MATTKTATIIGATGLIGGHLLSLLQQDNYYHTIRVLVRRPFENNHSRTEVKLIDFSDEESFKLGIYGSDVVFVTVGTTQQKVRGDKEAYRKVDYDIPVKAARYSQETGCPQLLVVSSVGANANARNFYLQLKGEMEEGIRTQGLPSVSIFRPSLLIGNREEKRVGEKVAQVAMPFLALGMFGGLSKYKPIHAADVAQAMVLAAKQETPGVTIFDYCRIKNLIRS